MCRTFCHLCGTFCLRSRMFCPSIFCLICGTLIRAVVLLIHQVALWVLQSLLLVVFVALFSVCVKIRKFKEWDIQDLFLSIRARFDSVHQRKMLAWVFRGILKE